MTGRLEEKWAAELSARAAAGLLKPERILVSSQSSEISIEGMDQPVLNFCANNYLGLANHPRILKVARRTLDTYGFGLSSVRFICGTQSIHKQLEERLAEFLEMEDVLLYSSCFDANGGLFEPLLGPEDTIVSARLNHASIIDGVRLAKCRRLTYKEDQPDEFDRILATAGVSGHVIAVTDGVFSMEGSLAPLDQLVPLAARHGALLVVDDSHATGIIGTHGRGTGEYFGCRPDLITSTLGKALGGATGGFVAGPKVLIDGLRNTSRPYLFSNSLAPSMVAGALEALAIVESDEGAELRARLHENTANFRQLMRDTGFKIPPGPHPIVPVMVGEAPLAARMAEHLLKLGIYVIGFSYPVVPQGEARIRVQLSALHTRNQIEQAVEAFALVGRELGILESGRAPVLAKSDKPPTMRAWVYHKGLLPDGGHLRLEEVPIPKPKPGELLLKVRKVSVCGTDEDLFRGKFTDVHEGFIPGHELFGEIVEIGNNVRGYQAGQKIVAESHYMLPGYQEEGIIGLWGPRVHDNRYLRPLNGAYAEYVAIPAYCAHVVPNLLDHDDFFPSLLEGVGNDCLVAKYMLDHGLLGHAGVVGCGPHGLFTQMFAKHFRVEHLSAFEIDLQRLALAEQFGADCLLNPHDPNVDQKVSSITGGQGFDCIVDIAGGRREVIEICLKYIRDGGTLILFGLYGDSSIKLNGMAINDIIFNMRDLAIDHAGKRVHVKGITGREGIWDYLIDAMATSPELQRKIMQVVSAMGALNRLGADTLAMEPGKYMKRAYSAFA